MADQLGIMIDLSGVRALVVGLAREGTALSRFLAEHGACVTATDVKSAHALAENIATLEGLDVNFALEGHPLALLDNADIVFVSPGVPLEIPLLSEARRRGFPLSSETRLFTRLCGAPVIGITGSSGKTTTTSLVGEMLRASGRRTWIGGNIGQPLISSLSEIAPRDIVVMELSSFQLELFAPWPECVEGKSWTGGNRALMDPAGWSPPVAAVLNLTPNHLDRHPSMDAYVAAKSHILRHQRPGDTVILNWDDPRTRQMTGLIGPAQKILWFSTQQHVPQGAYRQQDALRLVGADPHVCPKDEQVICHVSELKLFGEHNIANVLAACALASAAGAPIEALRRAATTFAGVEHRLQMVRELEGVRWYDDSIATTPERTVAALKAFPNNPIILLAGGRDKHLPWDEMAALTWSRVRHLVLFGEAAELIEDAMRRSHLSASGSCTIHRAGTLECAVTTAAQVAQAGDIVLLSPGGTSFDAFPDYSERGIRFQELVGAL